MEFYDMAQVAEVDPEELARVLELDKEKAMEIVEGANRISQKEEVTEVGQDVVPTTEDPTLDPVDRMEGVGEKTAQILDANGFKTIHDILETNVEKLSALPGIGAKRAEKLIQSAKDYIEGKRA
jgi:endonuclease III